MPRFSGVAREDSLQVAVCQPRMLGRQFERDLRDLRGAGLAVGCQHPGDQPGPGQRAHGHQARVREPALGQLAECGRADIRVRRIKR